MAAHQLRAGSAAGSHRGGDEGDGYRQRDLPIALFLAAAIPKRWRMMYEAAFSSSFHAGAPLALALGWTAALGLAVYLLLRRAVGAEH